MKSVPIFSALLLATALSPAANHERIQWLAENLTKHPANPVLDVGTPGQWDDKGCGCFSVAEVHGKYHLYYMGAGRTNLFRIGLATSDDGIQWQRSAANPVLPPGTKGSWDDRQVSMPYVLNDSGKLSLYYTGSGRGGGFGLATSEDGENWKRHGKAPVMRGIGGSMDPCVRKDADGYRMWYVGKHGKAFRIFRATSKDGIKWTRQNQPTLPLGKPGDYDERHHAGPVELRVGGRHYLFHLGGSAKGWKLGLAISDDGVNWRKSAANPILDAGENNAWDSGSIMGHEVIWKDGKFHVWYAAHASGLEHKAEKDMAIRIGYATSKAPASAGRSARPEPAVAPFNAKRARQLQTQWARHIDRPRSFTNSAGMKLMLLPPGDFTMGRTEAEFDRLLGIMREDPEMKKHVGGMITWSMLMMPAHKVRLTKPFYMGATEVTVGQFRKFTEATRYRTEAERGLNHGKPYRGGRKISTWRKPMSWRRNFRQADNEPVLHLTWNDCVAFCRWLSQHEGRNYMLPTEAQWEYACRAGTSTPWSFGDFDTFDAVAHKHAWWSDGAQAKHQVPRTVGKGLPNAFGLHDLHGNVWEYVADHWHRLYYKESPLNNPTGPTMQSEKGDQRRIIRGSSFDWGRWGGDSAYRMRITQRSGQHPHMGFRVAMRLDDVAGIPPLADAEEKIRRQVRDPGAESAAVQNALRDSSQLSKKLSVDLGKNVTMDFVLIPSGSFLMGSNNGPNDERPIHRVVISKPFYLAKHELTQPQWEAIMGPDKRLANIRKGDNDMAGPTKAMNSLSWNQCQELIQRLRRKLPAHKFALPTEAQWEYACRAGSNTEYCYGDDPTQLGRFAWHEANMIWPGKPSFEGRTFYHDTGVKRPNRWGLHDMHGGVWEWCADRYDADYYLKSRLVDPAGPDEGQFRVLRGGSWFRYANYARSAYRRPFHPSADGDGVTAWILDFGCRLAINPTTRPDARHK